MSGSERGLPDLGVFWLIGGSEFHDEAHDAFMTLPPYTRIRDGEVHQLGRGPKPCRLSLGVRKCSQLGQSEIQARFNLDELSLIVYAH